MYSRIVRILVRTTGIIWISVGIYALISAVLIPEIRVIALVFFVLLCVGGYGLFRMRRWMGIPKDYS
jgi:hypothetical protein